MESFDLLNVQAAAECTENCSGRIKRSEMFVSKSCGGQKVSCAAGGREPSRTSHLIMFGFVSAFAARFGITSQSPETQTGTWTPGAPFIFS